MFLRRALACVILFVAPLAIFAAASLNPHVALIMLIPMIGLVPGLIIALIVFTPVERALHRSGLDGLANLLVPVAGGLVATLIIAAMALRAGTFHRLLVDPTGLIIWALAGAAWGVVWRFSAWLVGKFRRRPATA